MIEAGAGIGMAVTRGGLRRGDRPGSGLAGTVRVFSPGFDLAVELERRGDRPDNDGRPAVETGMKARRGQILDMPGVSGQCLFRIDSLDELPALVAKDNEASG